MMTYLQIDKRWTGVLRTLKHMLVSLMMTKCCSVLTTTQTFTVTIDRSRRVAGRTPPPLGSGRDGTLRLLTSSKTRTLLKVCSQGDISLGATTSESREGARRTVITTSQWTTPAYLWLPPVKRQKGLPLKRNSQRYKQVILWSCSTDFLFSDLAHQLVLQQLGHGAKTGKEKPECVREHRECGGGGRIKKGFVFNYFLVVFEVLAFC